MLVRIVKMHFKLENIASFERLFEVHSKEIRMMEGCLFLALYQDHNDPSVFFTYSHWTNEQALERYRDSDFFRNVWGSAKKLFQSEPEAWSLRQKALLK